MKMIWETHKILGDDTICINPTCVRVPVFYGHSEALHIETREKITAKAVRELLQAAPGVVVVDKCEPGGYPTPVSDAVPIATECMWVGFARTFRALRVSTCGLYRTIFGKVRH